MKSRTLAAIAVAGMFTSYGALAETYGQTDAIGMSSVTVGSMLPGNISEAPPAMSTLNSLDNKTGGYKGWGPMANLATPAQPNESDPSLSYFNQKSTEARQLAEVRQVRDQVWVANAPLRAEYENIGATRSHAGGIGSFFSRDKR
jgi:hypothetical protein